MSVRGWKWDTAVAAEVVLKFKDSTRQNRRCGGDAGPQPAWFRVGRRPRPSRGKSYLKIVVLLLFVTVLTSSCSEGAKEGTELTDQYGVAIENAYEQHMIARVKACQTKEIQGLDAFAGGHYLEFLEKRVKDSECYPTELLEEEIEDITIMSDSSGEIEALIRVRIKGEQYYWLCTFKEDNGTWKITSKRTPPWD